LLLSIQTSRMLLDRIACKSLGLDKTKDERMKGCSIQEPQNSLMCIPIINWSTLIRFSTANPPPYIVMA
jgi:hypothetical protein